MKKVLFVCSGNTCRSPLAEGIAKEVFSRELNTHVGVSSAGSTALENFPASRLAVLAAKNHDLDLTTHQARLLNLTRVRDADLIVTMERKHRDTVGVIDPAALEYTFVITDFCDGLKNGVPDPVGGDIDEYEQTYEVILKCVEAMAKTLDGFDGWKKT